LASEDSSHFCARVGLMPRAVHSRMMDPTVSPFGGIPQRLGFHGVDLFPQHHALALACLLRVGVDARIPVGAFLDRCRVATAGDGLVVRYLDLADLIRMRRAVGRPKDLRRASELERLAARGIRER
jgi:hypothetical protein